MSFLISSWPRRLGWSALVFVLVAGAVLLFISYSDSQRALSEGDIMTRFLTLPTLAAICSFAWLTACVTRPIPATSQTTAPIPAQESAKPFVAQVVGLQWLNPLQRRDYPTEWQLLWTLGLVKPNKDDDMVRKYPKEFSTLQAVAAVAIGNEGRETFKGFHHKYFNKLTVLFHDIYFSSSRYFYNAHSLTDKSTWRELAGIRVEYALPEGRLDSVEAATFARTNIIRCFNIGNVHAPTTWSRSTPPDVHVTMGGPNAGFTSLSAALDYLQAHPTETVWAMNWDAPSFPPKDEQINENMVLLVLAGPNYKTDREPLAWIGYPATKASADFERKQDLPPRVMQAWKATLQTATSNAGKQNIDIGYVIHDANHTRPDSPDRIGNLAQILTTEVGELDFIKQTFNTPALLGEMGAGTALTNVALAIAYANHVGQNVLVAGTTDQAHPTAVLVLPPAKVRPIEPDKPWFRARGENNAYLMWWGIRHDADWRMQGYSK
jgi:hypothetical protein